MLALLPTAAENITLALPVEQITSELQARRTEKIARGGGAASSVASEDVPSTVEGGTGDNSIAGSFVHASRLVGEDATDVNDVRTGKSKVQLWNELKVLSVTRAFTLIYTLALLTLLTRIQLNLLGRRNYLSSVVSLAAPASSSSSKISLENRDDDNMEQDYGNDFETNRKYLTFSWWLLHRGWADVRRKVEAAVQQTFGSLNPRDNIAFEALSELTLNVRRQFEGATEDERRAHQWLGYLLPAKEEEELVLRESGVQSAGQETIPASLRRLLDETSDIIDSPAFSHVLTLSLDSAFSLLVDDKVATQAFKIPIQTGRNESVFTSDLLSSNPLLSQDRRVQELNNDGSVGSCKLATILAVFTRQAHAIGSGGNLNALMSSNSSLPVDSPPIKDANEYLGGMESIRDLEAFAAVVYSSNFELEGVDALRTTNNSGLATDGKTVEDSLVDVSKEISDSARDIEGDLQGAWGKAVGGTASI